MDVDNLSQFNSKEFFKLLGFYIQQSRIRLNLSIEQLSLNIQMPRSTLESIELGQYGLTDGDLRCLVDTLALEEAEILNLAKITQVQNIIDISRELNANFPQ